MLKPVLSQHFVFQPQSVIHAWWWMNRGRRCTSVQEVEASGAVRRKQEDLAWPVEGLIPVLVLELLSSVVAKIFRFGLGCHVGSEILCSGLHPRSIHGSRGALGWCLKRRLSFLQRAKLLKGVSVWLTAAWSVKGVRGGPRRELLWDSEGRKGEWEVLKEASLTHTS